MMNIEPSSYDAWLHRLAVVAACCCFFLLFMGGLVTSHQAGLSVPDWPTSFKMNMYAFPTQDWIGGIFFEHSHRLFASLVGLMILVMAIGWQLPFRGWWRKTIWIALAVSTAYLVVEFARLCIEATSVDGTAFALTLLFTLVALTVLGFIVQLIRTNTAVKARTRQTQLVRKLAWWTLGGVISQGVLGGLTVLFYLPASISTSHATLGQTVFCLTLALAVVTGRRWEATYHPTAVDRGIGIRALSIATVVMVVVQLIIGGVMRHTQSGLAIPTFPLAFGALIPDISTFGIGINFAHRVGAVLVSAFVITSAVTVYRNHWSIQPLRRATILSLVLLVLQITLGGIVILYQKPITPTTLHVSTGAAILGTMFYVMIQSRHLLRNRHATATEAMVGEDAAGIAVKA